MGELKVTALPKGFVKLTYTNCVYMNNVDLEEFVAKGGPTVDGKMQVVLGGKIFNVRGLNEVPLGHIGLNKFQRDLLSFEIDQQTTVSRFRALTDETLLLDTLQFDIGLQQREQPKPVPIDCKELAEEIVEAYGGQILMKGMLLAHKYRGKVTCKLTVKSLAHVPAVADSNQGGQIRRQSSADADPLVKHLKSGAGGFLTKNTEMTFDKIEGHQLRLTGQATKKSASRMMDTDFQKLGIGGLNREFADIFRRAFVSRILPPETVLKLGIKHVRGLMLYGPPGCGKTLIARQISKVLQGSDHSREPKIVSGPEVLSKFVGETEKNVRELFADAESEQLSAGDDSELHVIIFDEIDAICKKRGSRGDSTGVGDSLVNQLLAKIDGVNSLNNVLLIGMTNRLDMIDSALLRPGRFEVQIEIGLPDEEGREQIINIHTKSMRDGGCLANDVEVPELAKETKNFSGAEIEGLVKSAVSFATQRHINTDNIGQLMDTDKIMITADDFQGALDEVHPAFGVQGEDELKGLYRNGIIPYSESFQHLHRTVQELAAQSQTSARTPLLSLLLAGEKGAGKTALVAKLAAESGFAFTKIITADQMIGMGENQKCIHIAEIFEKAYKSPQSLIILDDIERLIDFVPVGPRFANLVLQALLVLINKPPPREDRKLMIIGTTSNRLMLRELGLVQVFNVELAMPLLQTEHEVIAVVSHLIERKLEGEEPLRIDEGELVLIGANCHKPIAVKTLLVVIEMARQGVEKVSYGRFMECLSSIGA